MATARKCDRCGLYYDSYNDKNNAEKINGIMLINIYSDLILMDKDFVLRAIKNELERYYKENEK